MSSALVDLGKDPYLLRCDPFVNTYMSTVTYPKLTATEAMLTVAGDVITAASKVKGVVMDAEFTTRLGLSDALEAMPRSCLQRSGYALKTLLSASPQVVQGGIPSLDAMANACRSSLKRSALLTY